MTHGPLLRLQITCVTSVAPPGSHSVTVLDRWSSPGTRCCYTYSTDYAPSEPHQAACPAHVLHGTTSSHNKTRPSMPATAACSAVCTVAARRPCWQHSHAVWLQHLDAGPGLRNNAADRRLSTFVHWQHHCGGLPLQPRCQLVPKRRCHSLCWCLAVQTDLQAAGPAAGEYMASTLCAHVCGISNREATCHGACAWCP